MATPHVAVIGAGIGGLTAAVLLAARGVRVTVLDSAPAAGGKLRPALVGGAQFDVGPTVFTMRWVFEEIFAAAGSSLSDHLDLVPASTLARHSWGRGETLDLFADIDRSADAIGALAGTAEAQGYRDFCVRARQIYQTLEQPFIRAARPTPLTLVQASGLRGFGDLVRIRPFEKLWRALGENFKDPRLRQLFARYATYCGSSPFLAPATLMLVAHVEQEGVWLVQGGMHRIAAALAEVGAGHGVRFRYDSPVAEVVVAGGRACGVVLEAGERIDADAVISNADTAAFAAGLFGPASRDATPRLSAARRSLSAVTWAVLARAEGFPLLRHTVFFSDNYAAEFDDLFRRRRLPHTPTVYVCAQDRGDTNVEIDGAERLLVLVNAPADGDRQVGLGRDSLITEIERCGERSFGLLRRHGLKVECRATATQVTTPADFHRLYPATGGALYGAAVHGPMASFRRPGARSRLEGLYLAGGSTHPGAGLPMAALSGRLAVSSLLQDWASSGAFHAMAMHGGISTRSATMGGMASL